VGVDDGDKEVVGDLESDGDEVGAILGVWEKEGLLLGESDGTSVVGLLLGFVDGTALGESVVG